MYSKYDNMYDTDYLCIYLWYVYMCIVTMHSNYVFIYLTMYSN